MTRPAIGACSSPIQSDTKRSPSMMKPMHMGSPTIIAPLAPVCSTRWRAVSSPRARGGCW